MKSFYKKEKGFSSKNIIIFYIFITLLKLSLSKNFNLNEGEIQFFDKEEDKKISSPLNIKTNSNNNTNNSIQNNTINNFSLGKFCNLANHNFPIEIESKLFEGENFDIKNFKDLSFNLEFYGLSNSNDTIKNTAFLDELIINSTIIDNDKSFFFKDKNINDYIKNNALKTNFDLTTKTVYLSINKENLKKIFKISNDSDFQKYKPTLYMTINKNPNKTNSINFKNLKSRIILFYNNNTEYIIPNNSYINDKIYTSNPNNYKFYRLQSEEKNQKFVLEFSSNYALSRGIYISFLEYKNISQIKPEDLMKNSSIVEFLNTKVNKGAVYHIEFKLKNDKKDIILCVVSKVKKSRRSTERTLDSLNYVFKYNTYEIKENSSNEGKNVSKYKFNKEISHKTENDKTIIEIPRINEKDKSNEVEIYVRKIDKNHRIKREEFDTIGIIESKYELVKGKVTIGENIKIEIPKIDENDYYSVLVDYPNEKEKYVFNTINTPKPESKVWILILIFSGIPLLLTIIIFVIIYASKSSNYDLKEKIMQTSFKESGAVEKSSEDEDNVLK